MNGSTAHLRALAAPDRVALSLLLRDGLPADGFLLHVLQESGIEGFFGAFEGSRLSGVLWERRGSYSASSGLDPAAGAALVGLVPNRPRWVSIVGPNTPCTAIAETLLAGRVPRVHREQLFMVAAQGDRLGPGAEGIGLATADEVDELVPLVARYRVEDRLARPDDEHGDWIRTHVQDRIANGLLYRVREGERIVFTGAFTYLGRVGGGLGGIYTVPEARGKGLAGRATADLCRVALEYGDWATLHVAPDNAPAIRAYERAGLRPAGTLRLTFR